MKTIFNFRYDSGHGWLEVPKSAVKNSGIASRISEYSYFNGDSVYLEEDMDMRTFLDAYVELMEKEGKPSSSLEIVNVDEGEISNIRNLPCFFPELLTA